MSDKESPSSSGGIDAAEGVRGKSKCWGCGKVVKLPSLFRLGKSKKGMNPRWGDGMGKRASWSLCCFGLKQSRTLEYDVESPTSDPTSRDFTFDMLRHFIESNGFYSEECNPCFVSDE